MICKALSVRSPWAWLIATGRKTIELRSRPIKYRGSLLICASLKAGTGSCNVSSEELEAAFDAPRGVCLVLVDVVDCRRATPQDSHDACSEPEPEQWAWVLANPRLVVQMPVKGVLGFFEVEGVELAA